MIISFDTPTNEMGLVYFPDWAFENQPLPEPILETTYIRASATNTQSIGAAVDDPCCED